MNLLHSHSAPERPGRARRTRRAVHGVLAAGVALLVAACSGSATLPSEITGGVATTEAPSTPAPRECTPAQNSQEDATRSYPRLDPLPAPANLPAGSTMAAIRQSGRLRVGVSADTLLFGARNALTGQIEGFDIDMLKEVAKAIFGPDGAAKIEFHVIRYDQRLPQLEANDVDIVAHTMTINCKRWLRIAFSTEYFHAGQKVLVKKGSGFTEVEDLVVAAATVCAPEGSTNIDEITKPEYTGIVVVGKADISDCLVAMQQGDVDAITGDDTVLAGFAAQDPSTEVVGRQFTGEPYGLGMNAKAVDFVQFVNAVLADVRTSGRWGEIYKTWLIDTGALQGTVIDPPVPNEQRPAP